MFRFYVVTVVVTVAALSLPAQESSGMGGQNPAAEGGVQQNGFSVRSLTVGSIYYSGITGPGIVGALPAGGQGQSSAVVQGSATVGWVRGGQRGRVSLAWSPQYIRGIRGFNFQSVNQSLGLTASRPIGVRWSLDFGASGGLNDFNQLLFSPGRLGAIAAAPASFDELAAALLTGRTENWALFDAVRTPATVNSPESAYLYGGRMLSASASASLSYAHSTRSTLRFSGIASRTHFTTQGSSGTDQSIAAGTPLLPGTSAASASVSWSYALSPRTSLGFDGSGTRVQSQLQDSYSTRGGVSVGRTLTPRWFVQGSAGAGVIRPLRQTIATVRGVQQEFGGSVGYKYFSHTFLGSFHRAVSDTYGIGANATRTASAGWTWSRPGSASTASASFGYSQLVGPSFPNAGSWMTNGTISRAFQRTIALQVTFSYAQFPRAVLLAAPNLSQTALITSLVWSPGNLSRH